MWQLFERSDGIILTVITEVLTVTILVIVHPGVDGGELIPAGRRVGLTACHQARLAPERRQLRSAGRARQVGPIAASILSTWASTSMEGCSLF